MKKTLLLIGIVLPIYLGTVVPVYAAPSKKAVNDTVVKAQKYYEGLYQEVGHNKAVVKEFYASPKSTYTIRHGVAAGVYYYAYTGDTDKAAKLENFAASTGYNVDNDLHSYIWKQTTDKVEDLYSDQPYKDCKLKLPSMGNVVPYHSKVCKLGEIGMKVYQEATKYDTLIPAIDQLQRMEAGQEVDKAVVKDLEGKFDKVGNGMPVCVMGICGDTASAIRTATFAELELRLGNMEYADKAAEAFIKAQDKSGAIYFSYDKHGHLKDAKGILYRIINKILSDNPIFNGWIPSNAESMNDVLAFLLHYRCVRFNICK